MDLSINLTISPSDGSVSGVTSALMEGIWLSAMAVALRHAKSVFQDSRQCLLPI